ncbi:MAG: FimV/HubP family polar landmark protein [Gammaproteobacteria bacterium]
MSKKLAFVLALALALLPLTSNALGLGEIKLQSALNQPLNAEIPVVGAAADEIGSLHVKLASPGQFQQAGIPMSPVLDQLKFAVVQGANGTASVRITTAQPFREPFLDVLVDATWDNGELIREYTVFLNPPGFEPATKPATALAAAPSSVSSATALTAPPVAASATSAAKLVIPLAAPVLPSSAPVAPAVAVPSIAGSASGGTYGPIQRGETLTEIALKVRPQGVTLNQMMIAIYRANPRVFMHNINLMKAGPVLRIPSAADIQAVNITDANSEVRTQIAAWRSQRGLAAAPAAPAVAGKPALTLVAPSAAEKNAASKVSGSGAGGTGVSGAAGAGTAQGTAAAVTAGKAPIKFPSSGLAAVESQAAQSKAPGVTTRVTPLTTEKSEVAKPLPKKKFAPPVQPQPTESGGIFSPPTLYIIIAVIILLLLIAFQIIRKRRASHGPMGGGPTGGKRKAGKRAAPAAETWDQPDTGGVDAAPAAAEAHAPAAATAAAAAHVTATAGTTSEPQDPIAEADFHMAYGLYDQAAEVLNKGLSQDPGRRDLRMKLLEVYFTAGNREKFLETTRSLRHEMGEAPDKDWEKVAIMGHQIAADDALFSGKGTSEKIPAVSVDIPLESTVVGGEVEVPAVDPLAGAFDHVQPPTAPAAPTPKEDTHVIDFELPDIEPTLPTQPTGTKTVTVGAKPEKAEATVSADFGTDSQVEFDKALKELSDFVNTNVPVQEDAAAPASGAAVEALSLAADTDVLGTLTGTGTGTRTGTGTGSATGMATATGTRSSTSTGGETTSLNEIGTKLDLARAYIDMGDTEGAKNILREVLEEGDREQTEEAQKLMQKLP